MGLMLSVFISYVGLREALECMKHILSGVIPDTEPDFQDYVEYYTRLLQKTGNWNAYDWTTESGQGYLCLNEDKKGKLKAAAVKFYGRQNDSTAILFSTKISSFGQDSVEDSQANGDFGFERYPLNKTKTIISNTSESFNVGNSNRSTTISENISDASRSSPNFFERDERTTSEGEAKHKLTWEYSPRSPSPTPLPEIHFQSYDEGKNENNVYSEEYLRSLDGIKFRPLQRSDPSGRRRSFRKRLSSSSNSSKESRASREEELKMFTSLEEAEFNRMNSSENHSGFGSTPNLVTRSYSRSRSREKSNERSKENADVTAEPALSKLGSVEDETKQIPEVQEEEEDLDFWSNLAD